MHPKCELPWLGREKVGESGDPLVRHVGLLSGKDEPLVREPPFSFFVEPGNDAKVGLPERDRVRRLRDEMTNSGLGRPRSDIWVVPRDDL